MHAMMTLTSNAYCIIYVIVMQTLCTMALLVLHKLYYMLRMDSYTSCQLNELQEDEFSIHSMPWQPCECLSWLQACSKTCLVEPERLHTWSITIVTCWYIHITMTASTQNGCNTHLCCFSLSYNQARKFVWPCNSSTPALLRGKLYNSTPESSDYAIMLL